MMNLIFLILPVFTAANIQIEITASKNQQGQNVNFLGEQMDPISDIEIQTFNMGDYNLKNAVEAYYGKRPDGAFLKNPTIWDELYYNFNWKPINRTLKPILAKVLQVKSEPIIVMTQHFENNSTRPASFNVGISQSVHNTVFSSWNTAGGLTLGSDINYEVIFGDAKIGDTMSFSNSWGKGAEESKTMTVGSAAEKDIMVQPDNSVIAELQSTKVTMQVEVTYEAFLSGDVIVNYGEAFKGYRLWALDVRGVMHAGNINNGKRSTEVIEIGFYSDSKIVVHDSNNVEVVTFKV